MWRISGADGFAPKKRVKRERSGSLKKRDRVDWVPGLTVSTKKALPLGAGARKGRVSVVLRLSQPV